jgi:hypothetical protein
VESKTKQYWSNTKNYLQKLEVYPYEETRQKLLEGELYKKYVGKAKNRTFIKENPKLYQSVMFHTSHLENLFVSQNSYKSNYSLTSRLKFIVELDCQIEKLKCQCGKTYNWTSYCRYCPEPKKNQLGKPHTEETKRKMRLSTISYLETLKGQLTPRYNKESIQIIEEFGKKNGYRFMHAENGGEYYIKELGYFLDGYDPIFNIALEIDESHHFEENGNLKQKDIVRQQQIEEKLGCKFIRLKYDRV